ncbi:hypothetical protein FEM48_Zijuj05G0042700 [Ziziphus jujuba var. spinosa]|uniref:Uncharacterized protein n=1 Tax=Ziziphus jujuba var. spinosa TaxID=714518 RepID=A0A978VCS5_ZIZJJ|nr:hypothetical protein FEM48_Zijuj05G0042700 [Ziziphus jujuba var. spinosa]
MKKINLLLRKCKSLSRQLGRSSSYTSLRSKSTREDLLWDNSHDHHGMQDQVEHDQYQTILVGSTRKRYVISSKYLNHPLLNALIEKSSPANKHKAAGDHHHHHHQVILVRCEVVLFDHLLWMLENADPNLSSESLEELASLYR